VSGDRWLRPAVHTLDVGVDLGYAGHDRMDVPTDDRPDVVHGHDVVRPGHGDDGSPILPADGERVVATRGLLGQERRRGSIQRVAVEVYVLETDLLREGARLSDLRLGG